MSAHLRSRLPGLFAIVVACAVAGGCALDPPPQDAFYTLAPVMMAAKSTKPLAGTILVNRLAARGLTAGRQIVFRDKDHPFQVQRYHYRYWADAPAVMIQDRLVELLRQVGIADYVITPAERAKADWIVSGSLLLFEHHPYAQPPAVVVELELGIVRADCRDPVFLKRYLVQEPAPNNQIDQAIPAFERALTRLIDQFLKDAARVLEEQTRVDAGACR
jgi:cholesterol transport system auxiliary component